MATRMCTLKTINLPSLPNNYTHTNIFVPMLWTGVQHGQDVWTDGSHIYYSDGYTHLVLDIEKNQWVKKKWSIPSFCGSCVWSDGEHIYHAGGGDYDYHILENGDWKEIPTWNICFWGNTVYTYGTNIYCKGAPWEDWMGDRHTYKLNRETNIWERVDFDPEDRYWTDGVNIYSQWGDNHYVLNKDTNMWEIKAWNNVPNPFYSNHVWSDGKNIYYSYGKTYILNIDTWKEITWKSDVKLYGDSIWTDGKNIYYSYPINVDYDYGQTLILLPSTAQLYSRQKINNDPGWRKVLDLTLNLQSKTIATNGVVIPDEGYDGLLQVDVNVPATGITPSGTLDITTNGTHTVTTYDQVEVNVPIPEGYIRPVGNYEIISNGTYNINQYETVTVEIPATSQEFVERKFQTKTVDGSGHHYSFIEGMIWREFITFIGAQIGSFWIDEETNIIHCQGFQIMYNNDNVKPEDSIINDAIYLLI